ncbi:hypothetical protein HMPREF1870_00402 [Bacteroidales bacterium KA00344]|nr:hypothetical protein HMPREF1870_00402 [Bacteroidales bacterium KA00344]
MNGLMGKILHFYLQTASYAARIQKLFGIYPKFAKIQRFRILLIIRDF